MEKPSQWDGTSKGSPLGNRIFMWLIGHGGLFPAYCLLVPVSLFYALFDSKSKRALRFYWAHMGKRAGTIRLWRHFFSFGMGLIDRTASLLKENNFFSIKTINEEAIAEALSKNKGVLILGAHLGNWEFAGNLLFDRMETPINFTMVDAEKNSIKEVFESAYAKRRVAIIPINQDPLAFVLDVRNALSRGEIVCMHGDRMFGQKGTAMRFLKGTVTFPLGPFAIAALTGAPIVPIFVRKKGFSTYEMKACRPIFVSSGPRSEGSATAFEALETYVKLLEQAAIENPYEWNNFYDFWQEGEQYRIV
jgi:predicted LPLAT superfamily acyltransferase